MASDPYQYFYDVLLLPILFGGLLLGNGIGFLKLAFAEHDKRKRIETKLRNYADELSDLYHNAPCGYHSLDQNGVFIRVNDTELKWLGYSRDALLGRKFIHFLTPEGKILFYKTFSQLKQRGWVKDLEFDLVRSDGTLLPVLLNSTAVLDASGNFLTSRSIIFDLSERKRAELEAIRNQDLREAMFNESADAIFLVDPETLLTVDCNSRAVELYEARNKQALINIEGHHLQRYQFTLEELNEIVAEINATGQWSRELEYKTYKGNHFWGSLAVRQITVAGKSLNLVRVTDVTARRQAEAQIHSSLQEKELLLKEIHHRVKNNLHIISNLLDLQSEQIEDERLLNLFADSQNRIQAMALIHEQLYQSKDFGKVEFGNYVHRLIQNLAFSYGNSMQSIYPVIKTEPVQINLDTAIPCGLLISELVTNAYKHAFPHGRAGTICIELDQDEEQQFTLKIWDDGVGLPATTDWQNAPSLGLKLVRILAKQLKASIHFDFSHGTNIQLTFSELKYKPRF
jgi:PAS domain S-box-containing protein